MIPSTKNSLAGCLAELGYFQSFADDDPSVYQKGLTDYEVKYRNTQPARAGFALAELTHYQFKRRISSWMTNYDLLLERYKAFSSWSWYPTSADTLRFDLSHRHSRSGPG